jgi:diguanylate cyclase (GGDEF)-like protein/PAS domain S-box-containing protein
MNFRFRIIAIGTIAAIYVALAKLGFTMAFTADQVTLVWPPTGLSLAALLLLGVGVWPGILLGAFIANLTTHEPLAVASCIAIGNTLEALLGAWLIRRFVRPANATNSLRYILGLVVLGAMVSTVVSATIGVTSLCAGGLQPWTAFRPLWWTWWLGDAAGNLLLAPVLLTWNTRRRVKDRKDAIELCLLVGGLTAASVAVFTRHLAAAALYPLEYIIFPFVIWAALRFGIAGAAGANLLTAGIAVWGTVHGLGPYSGGQGDERLMLLQIFMAVVAGTGLLLGATISESDRSRIRRAGMLDAALDCIISIDHVGQIIEFNPAAERTFGYSKAEVIGRDTVDLLIPERLRVQHRRGFERAADGGAGDVLGRRHETIALRADGSEFPIEVSIARLPWDGPSIYTAFLRDITDERRIAEQLAFRATHDGLTQTLNSTAFMERVATAAKSANIAERRDVAVLFVDLNKFKAINDRFGHVVGDRLLVATARRLRACVRPGDTVARMGGDEFAILLETVFDEADVSAVVDRIRAALDEPFKIDGHEMLSTASVGVALGSRNGQRPDDILRAADTAMYHEKSLGRP